LKVFKNILANNLVQGLLCWLVSLYIRLVHATGRWRVIGGEYPEYYWKTGRPFIICHWHGRILMMPYCWDRKKPISMLISLHRDGRLIADTIGHFGVGTVAGSSSRGGAAALRAMIRELKAGNYIGITPDGPRGPRMRNSDGIVTLARLSGVPVIPAAYGITRRRVLSSWDRFILALPFGRGVYVWGEPVEVAKNASTEDMQSARQAIEDSLNRITAEADRLTGHEPIEPAPREPAAEAATDPGSLAREGSAP